MFSGRWVQGPQLPPVVDAAWLPRCPTGQGWGICVLKEAGKPREGGGDHCPQTISCPQWGVGSKLEAGAGLG